MKRLPFFFTLLGSASIISGVDNAPEPDTWCMTYLSTYLVPVYNQASSLVMTKLAAESGKQTIAPSLKSTFFGNTSTQRTETGFDTSLPTSFVLRETSVASELSSDSLGSSTLGIEPSLAATESDGSITPPLTDEVVPSSTTDTNAIPTSSGLVEPAGRSVIFQVSVTGNEKRNIHKRQVTGGFVGNDKPKSCTFATTFILSEGKLFEGGAPIYYSGESYKELSGQDVPASGSIIKTFEDSGRLTFRNSGLPNGRAGFLGLLGACIPVDLIVYDVAQCQDGRLIGDDEHTSTISGSFAQETTTLEETDPELPLTSRILLRTLSLTSDSGASAITSISHSEPLTTEGGQPSSQSEFTLFTSTTDGLENTASISSTEADTTIDEGTTAISDTISGDTTTTTTADTDTTAAGTTPADTTTTSSGAPNPDCASTSNPYTAPNGITFTIACSTTFFDVDVLRYIGANNFLSCVQACSETEACVASQFNVPASLCIILSRIYVETSQSSDGNDVAIKDSTIAGSTTANSDTTSMDITTVEITTAETTTAETTTVDSATGETTTAEEATTAEPIIPDTTTAETTTAEPTTTEITTSAAPTSTTPATGCSALDNPVTVDGSTYNLSCNTGVACFPIDEFDGITFFACLQACSQDAGCDSLLYERDNSSCILCSTSFGASVNSDYDVANKQ
ncbi:unnamed protein product [Fusarium graminearum]|uniref:DUF7908 domain-containing protein n=1 Tax=Gibberella zeae TaxID=5518 RepID=A0A4E9E833_GIBZA|nr:hypothetical protein HG531_008443 [Fusarium graminearum]CAG1988232.1 unnamed protein product [Fusarium graminearum]CAG2007416.1 unnamed protein product [Fusarium graminearum]